jgi:hypothetical protein
MAVAVVLRGGNSNFPLDNHTFAFGKPEGFEEEARHRYRILGMMWNGSEYD